MPGVQNTIGKNFYTYPVTLSTTPTKLATLLNITKLPDNQLLGDVKQVTFSDAQAGCQLGDSRGTAYVSIPEAGQTLDVPVLNALEKVYLKSSSGEPTLVVMVYA
ncbi:hypothetical protein [Blastopirellula retiformator]|uniref:Uncharacterized protein n=1 Tax=Blastopirellula retiformator TaxID=2527970 RepID=A0A5C5UYI3_9BACT|nr:hypothetical protein [Blastopirellula retiformator]TWT30703.1 hypothetical protein Enr8_42260 [Blastopirellula retiformator]